MTPYLVLLFAFSLSFQEQPKETTIVQVIDALTFEDQGQIYTAVVDRFEPFLKVAKGGKIIWSGIKLGKGPKELEPGAIKITRREDGRFLLQGPGHHLVLSFEHETMKVISTKKEYLTFYLTSDLSAKTSWKGFHIKKYGFLEYPNPEKESLKNLLFTSDRAAKYHNGYVTLDAHNLSLHFINPRKKTIEEWKYPGNILHKWNAEEFGTQATGSAYPLFHKPSGLESVDDLVVACFIKDQEEPQTLVIFKDGQYVSRRETPGRITGLFKEGDHYRAHFFDAEAQVFYTETIEF